MLGRQSLRGFTRSWHQSQRALATSSSGTPLNGSGAPDPDGTTATAQQATFGNVRRPPPSPGQEASQGEQACLPCTWPN